MIERVHVICVISVGGIVNASGAVFRVGGYDVVLLVSESLSHGVNAFFFQIETVLLFSNTRGDDTVQHLDQAGGLQVEVGAEFRFNAGDENMPPFALTIDRKYVEDHLKGENKPVDLKKYII